MGSHCHWDVQRNFLGFYHKLNERYLQNYLNEYVELSIFFNSDGKSKFLQIND